MRTLVLAQVDVEVEGHPLQKGLFRWNNIAVPMCAKGTDGKPTAVGGQPISILQLRARTCVSGLYSGVILQYVPPAPQQSVSGPLCRSCHISAVCMSGVGVEIKAEDYVCVLLQFDEKGR